MRVLAETGTLGSAPAGTRGRPVSFSPGQMALAAGAALLALPTMIDVARVSWSTEQGAHGPIVFATAIWLVVRDLPAIRPLIRPGSFAVALVLLVPLLVLYGLARLTSTIEVEGFAMYACLLVVAYAVIGPAAMRRLWFPLFYMLFVFPPPDTLFAMLTQPLKIAISGWAVGLLHWAGYPIAGSGVSIQIGQYEMLVAAACAGLNSMISLTALGLFYVYIRHNANAAYMALLTVAILPVAVVANLVRVVILLLITYHFGEAAGQGFFHEFAGLTMFTVALLGIFALDRLGAPVRRRLEKTA